MRHPIAELSRRLCLEYSARHEKYNVSMADELLRYRSQFPILERTTYLISNSLGAMPKGVYEAMKGYADTWATRGVRAWEERWWMLAAEVGDEIGALMNAPQGSVSTHQNVTTCQAVVASCFDFSGKRNKVVYSDMNFPSVMYFWEAQRAYGARVHMVKTDDGITVPLERLLDAIDEQTLLVPVSHVIFRSAYIQDAKAIIEKAHKRRRQSRARHVSIAGHGPGRCAGAECGLRLRRRLEVAVRRAGGRLICTCVRIWGRSCSRNLRAGSRTRIHSASKPDPRVIPSRHFAS